MLDMEDVPEPLMEDMGLSSEARVLIGSEAEPIVPGLLASWKRRQRD